MEVIPDPMDGQKLEVVQSEEELAAEEREEFDAAPVAGAVGAFGPSLTAKEERIVLAMLAHGTVARAAEALRVHRRTIERTLAHQHVAASLRARAAELTEAAGLRLREAAGEAVEVLRELMRPAVPGAYDNPTPRDRFLAARTVLELAFKATEQAGPVARLEQRNAARRIANARGLAKDYGGGTDY